MIFEPPRRRRWRGWAAAGVAAAALAAGVLAQTSDDPADRPPPEAGSRFGPRARAERGLSLLDALAPLLGEQARSGPPVARSIRDLAARLPLTRQVAQLFAVGFEGRAPNARFFDRLVVRDWGGVVLDQRNYGGEPQQLVDLAGEVSVVARRARHVPPLVAAAQVGGEASAFPNLPPPAPAQVAGTLTPAQAASQARRAGAQLRLLGFNMTLAPVADVAIGGGPLAYRSYSDDSAVVVRYVRAATDGYRRARLISAVGYFPGEGTASQDPAEGVATVGLSLSQLQARDLRPFRAVAARVPVVVLSNAVYAAFDGVTPATVSPEAVRLLRDGYRFPGVVMTVDLTTTAANTGATVSQVAVDALKAGADLLYVSAGADEQEAAFRAVVGAVRRGDLPRARIQASLQRLLELKRRYRLIRSGG